MRRIKNIIEKLTKQCYDYKAERDSLIDDLVWYKAKVNKLERDNNQFIHDNNQLLHENEVLREQMEQEGE